jgi:hypothetical protein
MRIPNITTLLLVANQIIHLDIARIIYSTITTKGYRLEHMYLFSEENTDGTGKNIKCSRT